MKKIFKLITVIGIISMTLVSCGGSNSKEVKANENDNYLKYCGEQNCVGGKNVYIYEDVKHNKIVYLATDVYDHPVSIAVTDMN